MFVVYSMLTLLFSDVTLTIVTAYMENCWWWVVCCLSVLLLWVY